MNNQRKLPDIMNWNGERESTSYYNMTNELLSFNGKTHKTEMDKRENQNKFSKRHHTQKRNIDSYIRKNASIQLAEIFKDPLDNELVNPGRKYQSSYQMKISMWNSWGIKRKNFWS